MIASPALAQSGKVDGEAVLRLLVAKGIISQSDADEVMRAATVQTSSDTPPVDVAHPVTAPKISPSTLASDQAAPGHAPRAGTHGASATPAPASAPPTKGWWERVRLFGDLRLRQEAVLLSDRNAPDIINYTALNAGNAFNTNPLSAAYVSPPYLNTRKDRIRSRFRTRIGAMADVADGVTVQIRLSSGADAPAFNNQTFGANGGDFAKYAIWIDRASVAMRLRKDMTLTLGRSEIPFWTTELVFDGAINLDGASLTGKQLLSEKVRAFGTIGVFPTYATDLNFGSRTAGSFGSNDRLLIAAQAGADVKLGSMAKLSAAAAYYGFGKSAGRASTPCPHHQDVCDTDNTRTFNGIYGNSLVPVRTIIPNPNVAPGASAAPQYFGLATPFNVLNLHGLASIKPRGLPRIQLEADYIRNMAFDRRAVLARAIMPTADHRPGGTGYFINLVVGDASVVHGGSWNLYTGYKHIESDAMLDNLTDSLFHLGGTNARGPIVGGTYGLAENTSIGARLLSADQIMGQRFSVDLVQIDFNTRF